MLQALVITLREGFEAFLIVAISLSYLRKSGRSGLAAAGVAWLWSRFGHRINLQLFFQATAIFLFVFVVQLVIKGTHEMSEQQYLPYSEFIHRSTESWGPDSMFGHALSYVLVLLP